MRRKRRSRKALSQKGVQENNTTGKVSTQEAHRSNCVMSGLISPSPATYAGTAYIITCIMQKQATSKRHKALRDSAWRAARCALSCAGKAR